MFSQLSIGAARSRLFAFGLWILGTSALVSACGGDDSTEAEPDVELLDAEMKHYGKSYAQWSAEWVQYVNRYAPDTCANPLEDSTGKNCAVDQDPKSPVFFLTGAFGGVAKRKCTLPEGKALFLPIINIWGDNAGVPQDMLLSDADIRTYVDNVVDNFESERFMLVVDGHKVSNLEQGTLQSTRYTVNFLEDKNKYTCEKMPGVEGEFEGYVGGVWALLAPLSKGVHTVEFGYERGTDPMTGDPSQADFELSVEYELEIE